MATATLLLSNDVTVTLFIAGNNKAIIEEITFKAKNMEKSNFKRFIVPSNDCRCKIIRR